MSDIVPPSIGRIVHVTVEGTDEPTAAIITGLTTDEGRAPLEVVIDAEGNESPAVDPVIVTLFPQSGAPQYGIPVPRDDSGETDHSWRFPPRV